MRFSGPHYRPFIWDPFSFHYGYSFNSNSFFQSPMDLDFIDSEVEAQMDEEQMEEEEEITIRGAR